jgi:predicted ABC-type exoprotein transport system permease subunit
VLDLLLAAVAFPLIVAVGLALLAAVTLVPFVVALQMAQARAFSTTRWGAVALAFIGVGLLLALVFSRSASVPSAAALLPLVVTWAGPGALWLLTGEEAAIGGRAGAHER